MTLRRGKAISRREGGGRRFVETFGWLDDRASAGLGKRVESFARSLAPSLLVATMCVAGCGEPAPTIEPIEPIDAGAGPSEPGPADDDGGASGPGAPSSDAGPESPADDTDDAGDGPGDDAGDPLGAPMLAAKGAWTWVDFPDSACGNGTPTGIGVNLGPSSDVLVFLEGGGACWDEVTCYGIKMASNLDGFGPDKFASRFGDGSDSRGDLFDRTRADNPYKDLNFVYIPYCTGDVHGGHAVQTYGKHVTHHAGRKNIAAYLKRIVPTFHDARRVILSGSSAGGFGAALNFWRFQAAFPAVRVDLVDDSGPPFDQKYIGQFAKWNAAWDLEGDYPPGCDACKSNINAVFPYYAETYPDSRFALLSYNHDPTISIFFGITPNSFAKGLGELEKGQLEGKANVRYFVVDGSHHTMLGDLSTKTGVTTLATFLSAMTSDAPSWASARP